LLTHDSPWRCWC